MSRPTILITHSTPDISPHCVEFAENKRQYADAQGFDFLCSHRCTQDWAPFWEKIGLINRFLPLYDQVIWADMDLVFMNYQIEPWIGASWMGAPREYMRWDSTGPLPDLCCCLMVVRQCRRSLDFFRRVEDQAAGPARNQPQWEQGTINQLLAQENFEGVRLWSPDEIGGGWPDYWENGSIGWTHFLNGKIRGWQPGELMLHLGGAGGNSHIPYEWRRQAFLTRYQSQVRR